MARTKQYRLSAADRFERRADRLDRKAARSQRQRTADEEQEIAAAYDRRTTRALDALDEVTTGRCVVAVCNLTEVDR